MGSIRSWMSCVATVLILICPAAATAQERSAGQEVSSLTTLIAEVRQLRLAVEEFSRTQTQILGLSVYLSVQQTRAARAAASYDAARKELEVAAQKVGQMSTAVGASDAVARGTTPEERTRFELEGEVMKRMLDALVLQEQQARSRETELFQALQVEEASWAELISRLEQLLRK